MNKVVVDTNIFISGLLFGGNPEIILKAWSRNEFILCVSPELQSEIINKLQTKLKSTQAFINNLLFDLNEHAEQFLPQEKVSLLRDPKDNFLLELALEAKADYLISGDKDVLAMKEYKDTGIVSAAQFLNRYSK